MMVFRNAFIHSNDWVDWAYFQHANCKTFDSIRRQEIIVSVAASDFKDLFPI